MDRRDWYDVLVFLHILFVVFGFGPAVASSVIGLRTRTAPYPARLPMTEVNYFIGQRIIGPLAGLILVSGVAAAFVGEYDLKPAWIKAGIVLWLALVVVGFGVLRPATKRMVEIQTGLTGPPTPEQTAQLESLGK